MKYSLVIPCYNEEKNLPLLFNRCNSLIENSSIEIVLVNNGSTDHSKEIFDEYVKNNSQIQIVNVEKNQGYGFGILSGLRAAKGEYIGWTHADLQTDPMDLLKAIHFIENHKNKNLFLKGKRFGRPLGDQIFTIGMSLFESLLLKKFLWDINAQPTLFPKNFFETWQNPPYDFSLDLYAFHMAIENNLEIIRFPVYFGNRAHGISHWNINWRAKMKFIKRTISYSFELKKRI